MNKDFWTLFLTSNAWRYRLARTIVQGIIGVIIANLDLIVGVFDIPSQWKTFIVALIMAILSPIMAALGENVRQTSPLFKEVVEPEDSYADHEYTDEELSALRDAFPIVDEDEEGGEADV